jgi:glutamate--cysteine ligase catalytic subunit
MMKEVYNDSKFPVNDEAIKFAREEAKREGIELDARILKHIGFLYKREPLIAFKDTFDKVDEIATTHFEHLQSTNWNSVRFKPPRSLCDDQGW